MDPGQQCPAACVHMHCILLHMHANVILLFVCAHVALSTLAEDACFPIPPPQHVTGTKRVSLTLAFVY